MAAPPPTEGRALAAALAAPTPFRTRAGTALLHGAERHVQRFAPEGLVEPRRRRGSLNALSFVDRLVVPWIAAAQSSTALRMFGLPMRSAVASRASSDGSWVLPRPWYQDELDWMAAAREGGEPTAPFGAGSLLTTRGTFGSRGSAAALAAPSALGFVAPSLAPAAPGTAWSPLYGADAMASARLMQIAVETAGGGAGRKLASSALAAMAPALVAPSSAGQPARTTGGMPALRSRLAALIASEPAAVAPSSRLVGQAPAMVMPMVMPTATGDDLPAQRAIARGGIGAGAPSVAAGVPVGLRMVELLARGLEAGQAPASIAGPRLALPAGLGGLVGTSGTAASLGAFATGAAMAWPASQLVAPAPTLALPAVINARPQVLDHIAWSDRWLARLAGAQPRALAAFDAATGAPSARSLPRAGTAPAPVFVAPGEAATVPAAAGRAEPGVVRYDDGDVTPDEVLFAIAAARSQPERRPGPAAPAAPPRSSAERVTPADAVLASLPRAPGAGLAPALAASPFAPALASILPLASARPFDVRALFAREVADAYLGGLLATSAFAVDARGALRPGSAAGRLAAPAMDPGPTTLRPALLLPQAWGGSVADVPFAGDDGDPATASISATSAASSSRTAPLWSARPGMTAERSRRWATHTQHAAADLSLDFVSPELVLAARVYGLSPADAAHASRLATGGPTAVQALAGTVEMTFLRALAGEGELRGGAARSGPAAFAPTTAYPIDDVDGSTLASTASGLASAVPTAARRSPRGAFLWPATTVGALGMRAAQPDGDGALSIAALELLAAGAVAQLGIFAVPPGETAGGRPLGGVGARSVEASVEASVDDGDADGEAMGGYGPAEAHRARFQALYLALSQASPAMSATGQAARALAVASRGEGAALSARERAALAWSVLPMIAEGGAGAGSAVGPGTPEGASPGPAWATRAPQLTPLAAAMTDDGGDQSPYGSDGRPGLGALSGRAGEALSSFVAPLAAPAPVAAASAPAPTLAQRAPTATAELVRTAAAGRFGGGETEIPAWFEQAARKMLESRGAGDGISLAELTLVTAAPSTQVAASTRGNTVAAAAPITPATPAQPGAPDVEKLAQEVFAEFLAMMDTVRWRNNGEP